MTIDPTILTPLIDYGLQHLAQWALNGLLIAGSWLATRLLHRKVTSAEEAAVRAKAALLVRWAQQAVTSNPGRKAAVLAALRAAFPKLQPETLEHLLEAALHDLKVEQVAVQAAQPVVIVGKP